MSANKPLVSIIIPAHNEERTIGRTLAALRAQTLAADCFEVILIDDRSEDRTAEIARTFSDSFDLRIVPVKGGSIAEVRNRGAALARSEILFFLDADCVPRPGLLTMAMAVATPQTVWGAHYMIPPHSTWVGRVWEHFQATQQQGPVSFLPGGTLLIHRSDFVSVGGFMPDLETSEDVELCHRARQQHGMRVIAYPELSVFHYGTPQNLISFYRQNRWHGKHVLRAFLDHPSLQTACLIGLSGYTLGAFWCGLLGLLLGLWNGHWLLVMLAPLPLLLVPTAIALLRAAKARRFRDVPTLSVLYLTYLLARAAALIRSPGRGHRA